MGCDIHAYAERKTDSGKYEFLFETFENRTYSVFGFLAGVRNYSGIPPISEPRGMPDDISDGTREELTTWEDDAHSHSWLSVAELCSFDYDATVEDRRVTRQLGPNFFSGGCTCEPGDGKKMAWRDFLPKWFFDDLRKMVDAGADRVVFCFDN